MSGRLLSAFAIVLLGASVGSAAQISGEYLEARTCDVYTGPCFANGEIGMAGKEAVLAWKVDEGAWAGEKLDGLGVAIILKANDTLGFGGSLNGSPDRIRSVIVVDDKATSAQKAALVKFVRENAAHLATDVVHIESAPIVLKNDHLAGAGEFSAGKLARIETRKMGKGDCVCSNEMIFYPPLTKVDNAHPAYTLNMTYTGNSLDSTWSTVNNRGAFLATFER